MKITQIKRYQHLTPIKLRRNIISLIPHNKTTKRLIIRPLNILSLTSAPFAIRLNNCEVCSFNKLIFDEFQFYTSLILTPPFLPSIFSDNKRKAARQLSSTKCIYSFLEIILSRSRSIARKVSNYHCYYNLSHFHGHLLSIRCLLEILSQLSAPYCPIFF